MKRSGDYNPLMKRFLLYPHQLFERIEVLRGYEVCLVEESLFFTQYPFHAQKLVLHRASMKRYADYLRSRNIIVRYIEESGCEALYRSGGEVVCYDVADDWLERKIRRSFDRVTFLQSPNFLNHEDDALHLPTFYARRRKALGIWVENGKPLQGKWSFDEQNRERLPKVIEKPLLNAYNNPYVEEAKRYIAQFQSIGSCEPFYYPTSHEEARALFELFLEEKFANYGTYQDAIDMGPSPLFHSLISSSLNIGLLDLEEVIEGALRADAPINAKEGFIRQIIGWREFMFSLYKRLGRAQRCSNFFGFERPLSPMMQEGSSGIVPLDRINIKVLQSSYSHHIERLMVQGNLFLLTETSPDAVYRYFMSHYIDAYDWVMVGNVYGMSQYADGGRITTKPYISSSNYLAKMSYYPKNEGWSRLWDALYWRFMYLYSDRFATNPRMKMQRSLLGIMSPDFVREHCRIGDAFLENLTLNHHS